MTVTLPAPRLRSAGSSDTLGILRALLWRRALRWRRLARQPSALFAAAMIALTAGALIGEIPRGSGHSSTGTHVTGAIFLLDVLVPPVLAALGGFHIWATSSDAQWVMAAPGGPNAFLVEQTLIRILLAVLWTGVGLVSAEAFGQGRTLQAAALLVLVAALSSLSHTALSSLFFRAMDRVPNPRVLQLTLAGSWAALMLLVSLDVGGLGGIAVPFGLMVQGHPATSSWLAVGILAGLAGVALVTKLRTAAWYVEPIIEAGLRREQSLAYSRRRAAPVSWEGATGLQGAGAFLWAGLAIARRYAKGSLLMVAALVVVSCFISLVPPVHPMLSLTPAFGMLMSRRFRVFRNPARDEYFARAPVGARAVLLGFQARMSLELLLQITLMWVPAAFVWRSGVSAYLLVGLAGLLFAWLLSLSFLYASLIDDERPRAGLIVRVPAPLLAVGLGVGVWFASGQSPLATGAVLSALFAVTLGWLFRATARVIDRL